MEITNEMPAREFEMRFDPGTIEHLGVKMYSTLPHALAELISNSYDADAENVILTFSAKSDFQKTIKITDDGDGMVADEIQEKFLVIGRNRRKEDEGNKTKKFNRLPTGEKGLGKLALFGLAKKIDITTRRNGKESQFILDWDSLINSSNVYKPKTEFIDKETNLDDGTIIRLSNLNRTSPFDLEGLANSLSEIFIVDNNFNIPLESTDGKKLILNDSRRYKFLDEQFTWETSSLIPSESDYNGKINGVLYTGKTPLKPSSGLGGITLFSRGKLVNAPEYFSSNPSSHFFSYLTGWLSVDFIDLLDEDVITTNRQAINWEHEVMAKLRSFLSDMVSKVEKDWRERRKKEKS